MANAILNEVWLYGPRAGLTSTELLVLLRLADSASEDTRMGWESARTISKRIGAAERTVFRCLASLEKRSIISLPLRKDWPREALEYKSIVRFITPIEEWPEVTLEVAEGPELSTEEEPEADNITTDKMSYQLTPEVVAMTPVSYNPKLKALTTSSQSLLDTSYLESSMSAGQARPPVAKGWDHVPDKPKRPTARERDEAAKAEQDATDPFVSSSEDDDAPDEAPGLRAMVAESRQQVLSRRSTRAIGASEKLAGYFETQAIPQVAEEAAGRFSKVILAKNIAAWRKEGTPDSQIRTMIETYWGGAFRRNLATPAWKDFINQRGQLHAQSQKASTAVAWEANRLNDDYWV
jgi:hypothetical protein